MLIAVWNDARTIERAVRSALSDTLVNHVIVIDDGSTDDTASVVGSMQDQAGGRLIFRRLEQNGGPAVARNRGLDSSTAPWVAILDGDDYFLPNRMQALLDASEGADFVADDQVQIKEDGGDTEFLIGHSATMTVDLATFVTENLSKGPRPRKEYGFLKPIMRRSFLDSHQLRYDERLRLGEDFALYTRALAAGAVFRVIPERTYASIVRSGSISGHHSKADLERLRESSRSLGELPRLTEREKALLRMHYEAIDARIQWLNVIDAVKCRSIADFLPPFFVRWTTSVYLAARLWEQVVLRSRKSLGLAGSQPH
ncbi:glycosyltransferase family 2 protein [Bradyrhizobium roseum]|uniref:glycosyltransferase family 2 protein n=1 Tax=Bradyrhizobium roseum TaxID=3056648 RepID=UPI00261E283C|nr:glycosyltransferase [Bradyrhizobium roseus]WKA30567.1 glycosyltransferase [Bradyrhizobium roseus]